MPDNDLYPLPPSDEDEIVDPNERDAEESEESKRRLYDSLGGLDPNSSNPITKDQLKRLKELMAVTG